MNTLQKQQSIMLHVICSINEKIFMVIIAILIFGTLGYCLYLSTIQHQLIGGVIAMIGYAVGLALSLIRYKHTQKSGTINR